MVTEKSTVKIKRMEFDREMKKMRKINIAIIVLVALSILLFLDHFRIHGYWFDVHDFLLQTDSGLGFDSHEFFLMLFVFTALVLAGYKLIHNLLTTE